MQILLYQFSPVSFIIFLNADNFQKKFYMKMASSINFYEFGSPQKPWRLIKNIWYKIFNRETANSTAVRTMYGVLQYVMLHTRGAGGRMTWSCARWLSVHCNVKWLCWSNTVSLNSAGNLIKCPQKHIACYATSILRSNWVGPRQIEHYSHFKNGWTSKSEITKMPYHESDLTAVYRTVLWCLRHAAHQKWLHKWFPLPGHST
jgi:hypothetical protein